MLLKFTLDMTLFEFLLNVGITWPVLCCLIKSTGDECVAVLFGSNSQWNLFC